MPSTTDAAFAQFLNGIRPAPDERQKASTSHGYIRRVLKNRNDTDPSFPRILRDFLIGSAARFTKISPLDDIDVFIVMDGSGLYYTEGGRVVPSTIKNSGALTNPLFALSDTDGMVNSIKVLNKFSRALKTTYSDSRVGRDGQAVTVYLPSLGFTIDVVPAFYVTPLQSGVPRYLIPIGHNIRYWKATNPDLDKRRVEDANKIHNGMASHIVLFFKYWNKYRNYNRLSSYHVEVMCLSLLELNPIQNYAEGIYRVFNGAPNFVRNTCYDPKGLEPPIDWYLDPDTRQRTIDRLNDHQMAAMFGSIFANLNNHKQAIDQFRHIFGDAFPRFEPAYVS